MAFSLVRSLVKHTLKYGGNALGGGIVPIGSIASAVYVEWCKSGDKSASDQAPPAAEQASVRAELEKIVQDTRAYRSQIDRLLAELGAGQPEAVRQAARSYLSQLPARVQSSLRRPEDPSGRTVPLGLILRRAEDVQQLLPERMPLYQPGARPVPGTDLVIEELLGAGGFGEVWKARHQSRPHAPPVALKFCIDEAAARTLRKEVELLDRVTTQGRHKGIVELRYAHLEGDTPCLEYEYVEGGDLAGLVMDLHRAGKGTPLTMTRLFCSLAQAVGFAHRIQPPVVHRDLKPTNVLTTRVDKRVALKVADFGIGGLAAEQARRAGTETVGRSALTAGACTPLYASPQQRRGAGPDPRDDVYALGVIWYQMLLGDVTKEAPQGGPWKKRLLEQGATPRLLALLERCLEDDPADRPADAQVLSQELLTVIKEATPDDVVDVVEVVAEEVMVKPLSVMVKPLSPPPVPEGRGRSPDAVVRKKPGRPENTREKPRPVLAKKPLIVLAGAGAGLVLLILWWALTAGGRVSESKGSVPSRSKVNRETFDTLTVGMTKSQVESRLSRDWSKRPDDEFAAALRALPTADKEGWSKAYNEGKAEVYWDGAGTRILVAYSIPQSWAKAVAFYYTRTGTGLVSTDKKGNVNWPAPPALPAPTKAPAPAVAPPAPPPRPQG
jgi:serine/threonine protein kinase